MYVDTTHFPLVWTFFTTPGLPAEASPFGAFEALLAREQPFVLLNDEGVAPDAHAHTPEDRKQTALWMKQHKAALRAFVLAAIYVEPDAARREAAQAFAAMSGKFWGYPMRLVASKAEALRLAEDLLAEAGPAPR